MNTSDAIDALRGAVAKACAAMDTYPVTVKHWQTVLKPASAALRAALATAEAARPAADGLEAMTDRQIDDTIDDAFRAGKEYMRRQLDGRDKVLAAERDVYRDQYNLLLKAVADGVAMLPSPPMILSAAAPAVPARSNRHMLTPDWIAAEDAAGGVLAAGALVTPAVPAPLLVEGEPVDPKLPRKLLDVACRIRAGETLFRDDDLVDTAAHALKAALDSPAVPAQPLAAHEGRPTTHNADSGARVSDNVPAQVVEALRAYQQADADGVMVTVSREALELAIAALTAQPAAVRAVPAHESAWLVEWKAHGYGPQWWGFNYEPRKSASWCSDANNAIRFSRKEDADRMRLHIIAVAGLTGRHEYERSISVTEHEWPLTVQPAASHGYTYASQQETECAGCGKLKHTPLRIDAMGGYVCLTCIDQKLGSLLGEFGYPEPAASQRAGEVQAAAARRALESMENVVRFLGSDGMSAAHGRMPDLADYKAAVAALAATPAPEGGDG